MVDSTVSQISSQVVRTHLAAYNAWVAYEKDDSCRLAFSGNEKSCVMEILKPKTDDNEPVDSCVHWTKSNDSIRDVCAL